MCVGGGGGGGRGGGSIDGCDSVSMFRECLLSTSVILVYSSFRP